jgi:hypothetical protein
MLSKGRTAMCFWPLVNQAICRRSLTGGSHRTTESSRRIAAAIAIERPQTWAGFDGSVHAERDASWRDSRSALSWSLRRRPLEGWRHAGSGKRSLRFLQIP